MDEGEIIWYTYYYFMYTYLVKVNINHMLTNENTSTTDEGVTLSYPDVTPTTISEHHTTSKYD